MASLNMKIARSMVSTVRPFKKVVISAVIWLD
jgi:hypothetical protein